MKLPFNRPSHATVMTIGKVVLGALVAGALEAARNGSQAGENDKFAPKAANDPSFTRSPVRFVRIAFGAVFLVLGFAALILTMLMLGVLLLWVVLALIVGGVACGLPMLITGFFSSWCLHIGRKLFR